MSKDSPIIELDQVHLSYPVAGLSSHSLQTKMYSQFKKMVGGTLNTNHDITHVHALKNINLKVYPGERLGIYGHNGAGKTSLLRVLSGVYTPTSGHIHIQGQVSSLTDFTLGMELDASGVKNIIFRLVFMGHTFKQAKAAVDDIVEFSELGDFIHLPVRTYSTGMFMRLAFAISTYVMPDILILDEIIGTGDERFAKKCHQRITSLLEYSRVVILSTHDVHSLAKYCTSVIIMDQGTIIKQCAPQELLEKASLATEEA
jgi:ABC-type polysaccharide/polyol phosphate transport system ATPase subunit